LDPSSLPDGLNVLGDYFYPAASALVRLRVDSSKVVKSILATSDERKLQLLTWVLHSRVGSIEETRRILEAGEKNANLDKVLEMLKQDSTNLLPPLTKK